MADHKKEEYVRKRKKRIADMLFHLNAARLRENVDISAPEIESKPKPSEKRGGKEQLNAAERLKLIRNRLDQSRRKAEDGWLNRASATEDEGARGRTL